MTRSTISTTALTLFLCFSQSQAWISIVSSTSRTSFSTSSRARTSTTSTSSSSSSSSSFALYDSLDANNESNMNGNGNGNNMAVMSKNDLHRLTQMRSRQLTLPLLLVQDSLLPGQVMELASNDGKFKKMLSQLEYSSDELLCVVGMHPYNPGEPLNVGVSVTIEDIRLQRGSGHHSILKVRGKDIVDVQGQPRFHQQKSCFLADLELAQDVDALDDTSIMMMSTTASTTATTATTTRKHLEQTINWYDELLPLTTKWYHAMIDAGHIDTDTDTFISIDDIFAVQNAKGLTSRAHAVASLLNPSPSHKYDVCMQIRPALLACRNEYDRLHLVHTALQASLQQLELANNDNSRD